MISIRFKLIWIIVALIGAYLVVGQANAQTYGPTNSIRFINVGNPTEGIIQCVSGFEPFTSECNNILSNYSTIGSIFVVAGGSNGGEYTVTNSDFSPDRWTLTVTPAPVVTVVDFSESINISNPTPPNSTWGDDGFWGSAVTTEDVREDMVASVQATGANLWPLLAFLGVVLAFAIFGMVVNSISSSVKPKIERRQSKTFDSVAFDAKADELQQFFNKNGGAKQDVIDQIRK